MNNQVAILGECMLELRASEQEASVNSRPMNLAFGGDTLNTAIYMSRLGCSPDYITAVGDDAMSHWMVGQWNHEGVGCRFVEYREDAVPGMYLIETDDSGERSFYYWRDQAPVRRLFEKPECINKWLDILSGFKWLYLSGISVAIYDDLSRRRLFKIISEYRQRGGKVIFDGNYRPKLWKSADVARDAYKFMYQHTDLALPTIDDEKMLFEDDTVEQVLQRLKNWGVNEVVLKMGAEGCRVVTINEHLWVESKVVPVVDTTSAGDSFNAAYIAAKLKGLDPRQCAMAGHGLASTVIGHRGAIIDKAHMPQGLLV